MGWGVGWRPEEGGPRLDEMDSYLEGGVSMGIRGLPLEMNGSHLERFLEGGDL